MKDNHTTCQMMESNSYGSDAVRKTTMKNAQENYSIFFDPPKINTQLKSRVRHNQ